MISIFTLWTSHLYVETFDPVATACGVYISQLIRYSRARDSYQYFLYRGLLQTMKLLNKGFLKVKLKYHHFESFMVSSMTLLNDTEYHCHKWGLICFFCRNRNPVFLSFVTYLRVCNKSNMTGSTYGAGSAYPSRILEFTPVFREVPVLLLGP